MSFIEAAPCFDDDGDDFTLVLPVFDAVVSPPGYSWAYIGLFLDPASTGGADYAHIEHWPRKWVTDGKSF